MQNGSAAFLRRPQPRGDVVVDGDRIDGVDSVLRALIVDSHVVAGLEFGGTVTVAGICLNMEPSSSVIVRVAESQYVTLAVIESAMAGPKLTPTGRSPPGVRVSSCSESFQDPMQ
jgi:hypothetical protein